MTGRRLVLSFVLAIATSLPAFAQPQAWTIQHIYHQALGNVYYVHRVDLANGEFLKTFTVPSGVGVGNGVLTPDSRSYLLATSLGLARFDTATGQFTGFLGTTAGAQAVWAAPSGRYLYVARSDGATLTIDAMSGAMIAERCCTRPQILFAPDGSRRYELVTLSSNRFQLTAFPDEVGGAPLWEVTADGEFPTLLAATSTHIAYALGPRGNGTLILLNAATGLERARFSHAYVYSVVTRGSVFLAAVGDPPSHSGLTVNRVLEIDPVTLQIRSIRSQTGSITVAAPLALRVSSDGSAAYWLTYTSLLGLTVSSTSYSTIDIASGEAVGGGVLGSQYTEDIDVLPGSPCWFDMPTALSVAAEGGIVSIPVEPRAPCGTWRVAGTGDAPPLNPLNPGPHLGAATLLYVFGPTSDETPQIRRMFVQGRIVEITQPGGLPAAPDLTLDHIDRRVTVSWRAAPGPRASSFVIRGGPRSGPMAVLATILGPDRTWTSEPLPPGSYAIEVVGRLPGQQLGAPSNRVEFSVDVLDRPETPVDVRVSIVDDVARLSWNPSPTGPAPAAYRLEAAPAGATNFGTVAEALGTEFRAWRIPAGSWQLRVRAVTAGGASDPSPPLAITANRCTNPPAAPTVLPITEMVRIVTLRWTPGAGPAADSYVVEVGSNSGMRDLATIATSNPNTVLQTTAPAGRYFIRVRARNACGDSAPSNEVVVIVQ